MANILLVEDDRQNAHLVTNIMRALGHQVTWLANGDALFDTLHTLLPDLVILDMRLPGTLDGWEIARYIKQTSGISHILVLALSVEVEPEDRHFALEAGCDGFFGKPYDVRALREWIQTRLQPKHRA